MLLILGDNNGRSSRYRNNAFTAGTVLYPVSQETSSASVRYTRFPQLQQCNTV